MWNNASTANGESAPRHSLRIKNGISSSLPIYFAHLESDFVHEKSLKNHPHNIKTINFSLPHGLCIFSWWSVEIKKEEMEYFKQQIKYNKKSNKLKQKAKFKTMKAWTNRKPLLSNECKVYTRASCMPVVNLRNNTTNKFSRESCLGSQ